MSQTELRVKLASFEGPLDLLLYLIQQNEIDIFNINISEITDHYLHTLDMMRDYNLDIAGDFILMASTLILLKSRLLLPEDDEAVTEEGDAIQTQEELIRRLLEHQRFQQVARELREMNKLGQDFFKRPLPEDKEKQERLLREMNLTDLTLAFQQVLLQMRKPTAKIKRDPITIAQAAEKLLAALNQQEVIEFFGLFRAMADRSEVVATFLAILELARLSKISIMQHIDFSSIYITLRTVLDKKVINQELFQIGEAYAYKLAESSR